MERSTLSPPDELDTETALGVAIEFAVTSGPAVSSWQPLASGRHHLGRGRHVSIRIDDPLIEPHHAVVDVDADGTFEVIQLTGVVPIRVRDSVVTLGSSVVEFRTRARDASTVATCGPAGSIAPHPTDPSLRIVRRAPFDLPDWVPMSLDAPPPHEEPARASATALIGTAVTALGAVGVSVLLGSVMFAVFATLGAAAALATFGVSAWSARRQSRVARRATDAASDAFAEAVAALGHRRRDDHARRHRTVAEALDEAHGAGGSLWQRRVSERLPLVAAIGTGTLRWAPPVTMADPRRIDGSVLRQIERCARLDGVAAPLTLRSGDAVGLHGPRDAARAVARSVVTQLATWFGPADWQLVVVSSAGSGWAWVDSLPHGALGRGSLIVVDDAEGPDRRDLAEALEPVDLARPTVLVTDEPDLFAARTGPLRRFLNASAASSIIVVDTDETVPAICRRVLTIGATGSASWSGDVPETDDCVGIAFAGISVATADAVARRLAFLVDPEEAGGAGGGLASSVALTEVIPDATDRVAIAERWAAGGDDPAPLAPIGRTADGRVDIDLVSDGPHGLIAGTTGSGKSELLRSLVVGLAASVAPEHLNFVLVDYKGGSTFDACVDLPHTVGLVTDLDDGLAERALVSLDAELHRRERLLRELGASDLTDYRRRRRAATDPPIARLVVVIDEFAALAHELPDFLAALVGIAQRGRSLGVHLLLATQRPAGVVNDDIRANTNLRLALRLHDRADAVDVVGDPLPSTFARGLPGRAALRLGPDELVVFQAARCTGQATDGLDAVVAAIIAAAASVGSTAPHRPWVDPLPFPLALDGLSELLPASSLVPGTIGVVDDPSRQCRGPLAWSPSDGSLALIGSIGSGVTSTLIALAAATCSNSPPDFLHLYVIDARGDDGLGALADLAHCGGVVRPSEDERLHRLLARVVDAIERRVEIGRTERDSEIVLIVDGYASLRTALGSLERQATFDLLHRVVTDGPAAGVALVVADDAGSAIAALSVAHRWVFHLDDQTAARGLGMHGPVVGAGTPGRLRVSASGLEAQVARGAAGLAALPARSDRPFVGPPGVAVLPDRIAPEALDAVPERFVIGVGADDLRPARIDVVDGDHVLIVGGPRTGVTTALQRCAAACGALRVVRIDRRIDAQMIETLFDPTPTLVVVDNAHRVDDPGLLAAVLRGDHPHLTVIAGARADAVRAAYGHWTREVAKLRCGLVMTSRGDPDGDIFGVQIPRRALVPARPGLAWIVDSGPLRQVQLAFSS